MKSTPQVKACLNGLLRHELTLINQYFLHARLLKNFGYEALGGRFYKQSIRAMKNADKLIERIFLLEGLPNLQDLGKLYIGEHAQEAVACDLRAAGAQRAAQQEAVTLLEKEEDYVSRALVEALLADTEDYIDWLEEQQNLIEETGLANYLQSAAADAH